MKILQIGRDLRQIRRKYAECQRRCDSVSGVYEWLCDNFYLYEREGKWAKKELKRVNKYTLGDKGERLKKICAEFTDKRAQVTSPEVLEYLSAAKLTVFETDLFPAFYRAALIHMIADSLHEDTEENRGKIAYATRSLVSANGIDVYAFSESISPIEKILRNDPAGTYGKMSKETRAVYRRRVAMLARGAGVSEIDYAELKMSEAERDKKHVGEYLNLLRYNTLRGKVFIVIEILLPLIFSIYMYTSFHSVWFAILSYLPLWALFSRFVSRASVNNVPPSAVLRMDRTETCVTDTPVLIVVSTLLPGAEKIEALKSRLQLLRNANPGEAIKICVLADLKPSEKAKCAEDSADIKALQKCITALNTEYGGGFIGIVRERTFSKTQGVYTGYERKRGAIEGLVNHLRKPPKQGAKSEIPKGYALFCGDVDEIHRIKYLLVLDSDTDLPPDTVEDLVSVAVHPINAGKYGIFTPTMETKIEDASRTSFARILAGSGGISAYNGPSGERYQDLFGYSLFSGKGLIDVDLFYETLSDAFKEETVLSHDILEGELLGVKLVSDTCVAEGFPSNELAYFARQDRWVRGDIQNIVFLFMNPENGRKFSALSKYKLLDNIRRAFTPILQVAFLMMGGFLSAWASTIAAVTVLLSFAKPADMFMLFHSAYTNLLAILRGLYRRFISHKKLLEWVTAAQADRENSFGTVLRRTLPSVIGGIVLLVLPGAAKLFGVTFLLDPIVAYFTSKTKSDDVEVGWTEREKLVSYAAATWRYYDLYAGKADNYLPPDNVQETPVFRIAHRTSPTNIGFLLLCTLSACDFGFIDAGELYTRLDRTLTTVEKLQKYRGNLLNWYDTGTLEPLKPTYVSTVDSGNFLCLLTALREGLKDYEKNDSRIASLRERCDKLINDTDISFLYDKHRKLFYIGYSVQDDKFSESYYDLLMSEARMTGYYAIAKRQVPKEHWSQLSRIMSKNGRHFGPLSWTGTMFEFYLPHILLPVYKNSLSEKALKYCEYNQKKRVKGKQIPFGMSESGFYAFDRQLNYQYKAHGVQKLGLKRGLNNECVISPYSSFLLLPHNHKSALKNLEMLADMEMVGRCGFYEAADFTSKRTGGQDYTIVRSYMAHHVGMSMLSLSNAAFNNIMQKRFMSDSRMSGTSYLLMEKVPKKISVFKDVAGRTEPARPARAGSDTKRVLASGDVAKSSRIYTNGEWSLVAFSNGMSRSLYRGLDITVPPENCHDAYAGARVFLQDKDGTYPVFPDKTVYRRTGVAYIAKKEKLSVTLESAVHPRLPGEIRRIILRNTGRDIEKVKLYFWVNPFLTTVKNGMSHPAFTKMFMVDSVEGNIAVITRNSENEGPLSVACGLINDTDTGQNVSVGTSNLKFLQAGGEIETPGVPDACAAFEMYVTLKPGKAKAVTFFMCAADGKDEALDVFARAAADTALGSGEAVYAPELFDDEGPEKMLCASLLPKLLYPYSMDAELAESIRCNRNDRFILWKYGVSGDNPILFQKVEDKASLQNATTYIRMVTGLKKCGISVDLVFVYDEKGNYAAPIRHQLDDLVRGEGEVISGNIFTVDMSACDPDELNSLRAASDGIISSDVRNPEDDIPEKLVSIYPALPAFKQIHTDAETDVLKTSGGIFAGDSFHITCRPLLPWSVCLANQNFGTLLSDSCLGFTWALNSRENKLTKHRGFSWQRDDGERLLVSFGGKYYDVIKGSAATFTPNAAVYDSKIGKCYFRVKVYVPEAGMTKRIQVEMRNAGDEDVQFSLGYYAEPAMGTDRTLSKFLSAEVHRNGISVTNEHVWGIKGYAFFGITDSGMDFWSCNSIKVLAGKWEDRSVLPCAESCVFVGKNITLSGSENTTVTFSASFAKQERAAVFLGTDYQAEEPGPETRLKIHTEDKALNVMVNTWLPMQMKNSRMFGKCGFYQCGGAFGFRDQLQDAMNIVMTDPKLAKQFIIRCAAAQFSEGDVMHWWHNFPAEDGGIRGIRTRCSDDMLWLPLALSRYVECTGDASILETKIAFMCADKLGENERERYSNFQKGDARFTVYEHGKRAIAVAENYGAHGLLKIGTGDWNDGYNYVGEKGIGESVWLSMFAAIVMDKFADIADKYMKDTEYAGALRMKSESLKKAIDEHGWDGKWYSRAIYDDGEVMGSENSSQCQIDSLSQSFATICNMPDASRRRSALYNALEYLCDNENGVVRLFWPPLTPDGKRTGYVNYYAPGTRENGGQYTHAACWLALSLFRSGNNTVAYLLLKMLNPVNRYFNVQTANAYLGEPYALAGDVYSVEPYCGRAGWTLYTGAAGWYYRTAVEEMLGITMKNGQLSISPNLPSQLSGYTAEVTIDGKKRKIHCTNDNSADKNLY